MYYPKLRPQLNGHRLQSINCGVKATQMGLDWLSLGDLVPNIDRIRELGQMGDEPTNYYEWDRVIDDLGGRKLGAKGVKTNDWDDVAGHLRNGGASIVAVDYGKYRRSMQAKSGSVTFNGYHAILFVNRRKHSGTNQTRSFDSLLDGRYKGCPDGPVWVPFWKTRDAAETVGRKEGLGGGVFAVNLFRDVDIAPVDPGDVLAEDPASTLVDTISDLYQSAEDIGPTAPDSLHDAIADLEALVGVRRVFNETGTEVAPGISFTL